MIISKSPFLFLTITLIIGSSCQQNPKKEADSTALDSLKVVPFDTVMTDSLPPKKAENPFDQMLKKPGDTLVTWGFTEKQEKILKTKSQYDRHWWLKIFKGPISKERQKALKLQTVPRLTDFDLIDSIRQINYIKGWKFVIEEWTMKDEKAAQRWLDIAIKTKRLDDFKPPRVYWKENDKLYFIMGSAAKDWFEHGNQLVQITTGKTRWLIELLNNPIDLPKYKKDKRNANSGTSSGKEYYFKPDTMGTYYHYFGFHELRRQYGEQVAWRAVEIDTYKYGSEIGDYYDTNEEFISLKAREKDRHLDRLNLVGTDRSQIIRQFGPGDQKQKGSISYLHNSYWLLLGFENEKVNWFQVTRVDPASFDLTQLTSEDFKYR